MQIEKDLQKSHSPKSYIKLVTQNCGQSGSKNLHECHQEDSYWVQSLMQWNAFSLDQVRISHFNFFPTVLFQHNFSSTVFLGKFWICFFLCCILITSCWSLKEAVRSPCCPPLFKAEQGRSSHPLLLCHVVQPLYILIGFCCTNSWLCLFVSWSPKRTVLHMQSWGPQRERNNHFPLSAGSGLKD